MCTMLSPSKNQVDIYDRRLWYLSLVVALHRSFYFLTLVVARLEVDRIESHIYLQTIHTYPLARRTMLYRTNDNKKCSNLNIRFFSRFVLHSLFFVIHCENWLLEVKEKSVLSRGNTLKTTYQRRKITKRNER